MFIDDIFSLHKMHSALSPETKRFFQPTLFHPKPWLRVREQILLILSSIALSRCILVKILPRAVYLTLVAVNSSRQIVAFSYVNLTKKLSERRFEAMGGTVVRDDYQNRGVGSQLLREKIEFVRISGVSVICALVSAQNTRMLHLNQKQGFQIERLLQRKNPWDGRLHPYYEMRLQLV